MQESWTCWHPWDKYLSKSLSPVCGALNRRAASNDSCFPTLRVVWKSETGHQRGSPEEEVAGHACKEQGHLVPSEC